MTRLLRITRIAPTNILAAAVFLAIPLLTHAASASSLTSDASSPSPSTAISVPPISLHVAESSDTQQLGHQPDQSQHQAHPHPIPLEFNGVQFESTELDIGYEHNHKRNFWTVYWIFNFLCIFFCGTLIYSIYQNPRRSTNDVLVGSLCFSLFLHGIACGLQCFFSMIFDRFVSGMTGCYTEALIHMIAFDAIMGNLALISFDSRRTVQTGRSMGIKRVLQLEVAIWILSPVSMFLFAIGSPIYMTPSGLFCFFSWRSPLMYAAFLPLFVATTVILSVNYFVIFRISYKTISSLKKTSTSVALDRKVDQMRLAQKLFGFVLLFLIGFGVFVSGVLAAVIMGPENMYDLDAIGGVFIVMHGAIVPITYGLINPRIRGRYLQVLSFGWYKIEIEESYGSRAEPHSKSVEADHSTGEKVHSKRSDRANSHGVTLATNSNTTSAHPAGGRHARAMSVGHALPLPIGRVSLNVSTAGTEAVTKGQHRRWPTGESTQAPSTVGDQHHERSVNHAQFGFEVQVTAPDSSQPSRQASPQDSTHNTPPVTPSQQHELPSFEYPPATDLNDGVQEIIITIDPSPMVPVTASQWSI